MRFYVRSGSAYLDRLRRAVELISKIDDVLCDWNAPYHPDARRCLERAGKRCQLDRLCDWQLFDELRALRGVVGAYSSEIRSETLLVDLSRAFESEGWHFDESRQRSLAGLVMRDSKSGVAVAALRASEPASHSGEQLKIVEQLASDLRVSGVLLVSMRADVSDLPLASQLDDATRLSGDDEHDWLIAADKSLCPCCVCRISAKTAST